MTDTVEATIADLDALLADSAHDRCKVAGVTHAIPLPFGFRIKWSLGGGCRRRAVAVVTIVCPEHGEQTYGVCRKHLALLRRDDVAPGCGECDREVVLRDLAS